MLEEISENERLSENLCRPYIKISLRGKKRDNAIKSLVKRGLTRKEIAKKLELKYFTLTSYLFNHPEIPKPVRIKNGPQSFENYEIIKKLIRQGFNQVEIANELMVKKQAVNDYLSHYPELREIYDEKRRERRNKIWDIFIGEL